MKPRPRAVRSWALAAGSVCVALGGLCGCYERVVAAKGFGSDRYAVEESYRSDTALDRAWDGSFGAQKPPTKQRWHSTPTTVKAPPPTTTGPGLPK